MGHKLVDYLLHSITIPPQKPCFFFKGFKHPMLLCVSMFGFMTTLVEIFR